MSFYIIKKKHAIDLDAIVDLDLQGYGVTLDGKVHHSLTFQELKDLIEEMVKVGNIASELGEKMVALATHYKTNVHPPVE